MGFPFPAAAERRLKKILAFVDGTSTWIGKSASLLSLFVAGVIALEILMRGVLVRPTTWASESTVFACGLIYLLGGAWTLKEDKHVRIDMLYSRWSLKKRAVMDCLTFLPFSLYILVMLWATWVYTAGSIKVRETTMSPWDPPIYPMKIAMTTAFILLYLQGAAKLIRDLHFAVTGKDL
jgi:TRAP-type mannitol/chloroaromatic compound transport system permease small subunit